MCQLMLPGDGGKIEVRIINKDRFGHQSDVQGRQAVVRSMVGKVNLCSGGSPVAL